MYQINVYLQESSTRYRNVNEDSGVWLHVASLRQKRDMTITYQVR